MTYSVAHLPPEKIDALTAIPGVIYAKWKREISCPYDAAWIVARELGIRPPEVSLVATEEEVRQMPGVDRFRALFSSTMAPYQIEGSVFLARRAAAELLDEPRLRKSATTLGAITLAGHGGRVLIICPGSVKNVWADEIARWLGEPSIVLRGRGSDEVDERESFTPEVGDRRSRRVRRYVAHDLIPQVLRRQDGRRKIGWCPWPPAHDAFCCRRHPEVSGPRPAKCPRCLDEVRDIVGRARWVIVGHELLYAQPTKDAAGGVYAREDLPGWTDFLLKYGFAVGIWDEAHNIARFNTAERKKGKTLREQIVRLSDPIDVFYVLDGTPTNGYTRSWWPHCDVVTKGASTGNTRRTPFSFTGRYCNAQHVSVEFKDGSSIKHWTDKGHSELADTEWVERRKFFCIQRRLVDVAKDLPPLDLQLVQIETPEEALYKEYRFLKGSTKGPAKTDKLRRMAAQIKAPHVVDGVVADLSVGRKCIVGSFNPETGHLMSELLTKALESKGASLLRSHNAKLISTVGADTDHRHAMMQTFRDHSGACVYNCTIGETVTGSLRGAASVHAIDFIDDPARFIQFLKRAHEIGTRGLMVLLYAAEDTVDVVFVKRLVPKLRVLINQLSDENAAALKDTLEATMAAPLTSEEIHEDLLAHFHLAGISGDQEEDPEWRDA